jgi:hypothetical protein
MKLFKTYKWPTAAVLALILPAGCAHKPPAEAKKLSDIAKKYEEQGLTLNEVEFEDGGWEVEGFDAQGQHVEFDVNAVTGEKTK